MKPLKVNGSEVFKAIESGEKYIQIGDKKYFLMEVEEVNDTNNYQVTDPDEEEKLLKALNQKNRILADDEIMKILRK